MFVAVTITDYHTHPDFCVVNVHTTTHETCSFSFNMEYLFEWVNTEDRVLFLLDVFSKKIEFELGIYLAHLSWDLVDFSAVIITMLNMWNEETRTHKIKTS